MLVIKRFSERKKDFRWRKKTGKIRAKRSFFLDVAKSLSLEYEHVAMNLTLLEQNCADNMANEHVPSSATTRSDDQILLFNAWVPIGKGNHVLDLQKKKRNPILRSLWRLCITQTSSELSLHQPMFLPALQ
ncbi:hypothetical protein Tco_0986898 [Tanacetum coccineum]